MMMMMMTTEMIIMCLLTTTNECNRIMSKFIWLGCLRKCNFRIVSHNPPLLWSVCVLFSLKIIQASAKLETQTHIFSTIPFYTIHLFSLESLCASSHTWKLRNPKECSWYEEPGKVASLLARSLTPLWIKSREKEKDERRKWNGLFPKCFPWKLLLLWLLLFSPATTTAQHICIHWIHI